MSNAQLRKRPVRNPRLKRPIREHATLGKIEYVNYDGGWGQGGKSIGDEWVRIDVQQMANIDSATLDRSAEYVDRIQQNRSAFIDFVRHRLLHGPIDDFDPEEFLKATDDDISHLPLLRIYMLVLWDNFAEVQSECDLFPTGKCAGHARIEITIRKREDGGFQPTELRLRHRSLFEMAEYILERPVPAELTHYANSLPDQFVATYGTWGWLEFHDELREKLDAATQQVRRLMNEQSEAARKYLRSVQLLLELIAAEVEAKE